MNQEAGLPTASFSTHDYRQLDRLEVLRVHAGVLFDQVMPNADDVRWAMVMQAFHLGKILVGANQISELRGERTGAKTRSDGIDHYIIQLNRGGSHHTEIDGRTIQVATADIQIFDLARPMKSFTRHVDNINVVIPRQELDALVRPLDGVHGLTLRGQSGAAGLLADFILSLERRLPALAATDATLAADATIRLVAACVAPSAEAIERARGPIHAALRSRVKQHVERNLLSSNLSVDSICATLRISRPSLYRLMEEDGGVSGYIQTRRLLRARACLAGRRPGSISDIAAEHGFKSLAHFSRAFHGYFGRPPRDVRDRRVQMMPELQSSLLPGPGYNWVAGLLG